MGWSHSVFTRGKRGKKERRLPDHMTEPCQGMCSCLITYDGIARPRYCFVNAFIPSALLTSHH